MGTHSTIGMQTGPDTARVIYAHWNGQPSWMGRQLQEHFNTQERVESLIAKGDVSSIESGKPKHYHEWRGEGREPWERVKPRDVALSDARIENTSYMYLWRDGTWFCDGLAISEAIRIEETYGE